MLKRFIILAIAVLVSSFSNAYSLPRFALRGGDIDCRGCHVNPTGGELRTSGGDNFAMNRLAMWKKGQKFSANIGEGIRIGGDFRSQYLYFADHSTGIMSASEAGSSTIRDTTTKVHGAQEMSLPVYIAANFTDATTAFVKFDMVTQAYEGYALLHFVHSSGEYWESGSTVGDAYLKIGAFLPAFGIRFDDHTVYTRGGNASLSQFGGAGLFWAPNYKDEGAELGVELFDRAFITVDYLNGNELVPSSSFKFDFSGPAAFSLRAVYSNPIIEDLLSIEVGGSAYLHSLTNYNGRDTSVMTKLFAVHGGLRIGPVSVLAEADFGTFIPQGSLGKPYADSANAVAVEAAANITQGLMGLVRYDSYSDHVGGVERIRVKDRFMIGLQWFPVRFLEVRPELRLANVTVNSSSDPNQIGDHKETTLLLQTHLFF